MDRTPYTDRKKVARGGNSICVYLNKVWGIEPGTLVDITIASAEDPSKRVTGTKKVCRDRVSSIVYLDKVWGFKQDEIVDISVMPRGTPDGA